MKINYIGLGLFRSGGMRAIFDYANHLTAKGHDLIYYYPVKSYKRYNDGIFQECIRYWSTIKHYLHNNNKSSNIYSHNFEIKKIPFINNYFIRDADVSIATEWPTAYSVNSLSTKKGKKIYYIQDYEIWGSDIQMVDKSYKLNLNKITVSKYLHDFFLTKFNVDSKMIMNCVDYDIFNPGIKNYNEIKNITFLDHQLKKKGVDYALSVILKLKEKYKNIKFTCFGYRKFHAIPDFVHFIENPSDETIVDIYRRTDILLFPSIDEGLGIPPAEAMACKCAVVTTPVGAIADYSTHMQSAIHVQPGNIDEMFNAASYLIDNPKEIVRISENAYHNIRNVLNWDRAVEEFEKFLIKC